MFKKILCLLLTIISFAVFTTEVVSAEEYGVNYLYTWSCSSALSVSGLTGTCYSTISCPSTTTKIEITQTLQVKDGNHWRTSQTWTKTVYGHIYDLVNTRTLYSGNTYRVKSEFVVYRGTNSETITVYSSTKST